MINVFMVDNNESTIKEVKQYFKNSEVCIKNSCSDGRVAVKELLKSSSEYDVLLLNPILSSIDGIELLKQLSDNNIIMKTIIYSELNNMGTIYALYPFNISFYLLKSVDKEILKQRIIESTKLGYQEYEFSTNSIDKKVSEIVEKNSFSKYFSYLPQELKKELYLERFCDFNGLKEFIDNIEIIDIGE